MDVAARQFYFGGGAGNSIGSPAPGTFIRSLEPGR